MGVRDQKHIRQLTDALARYEGLRLLVERVANGEDVTPAEAQEVLECAFPEAAYRWSTPAPKGLSSPLPPPPERGEVGGK